MQSDYDSNLPPFFEDWGGRDHRTAAGPANRQKKLDIKYLSLPLPVRQTPLQNNVQFFLL